MFFSLFVKLMKFVILRNIELIWMHIQLLMLLLYNFLFQQNFSLVYGWCFLSLPHVHLTPFNEIILFFGQYWLFIALISRALKVYLWVQLYMNYHFLFQFAVMSFKWKWLLNWSFVSMNCLLILYVTFMLDFARLNFQGFYAAVLEKDDCWYL